MRARIRPSVLPFEEWRNEAIARLLPGTAVKCPKCNGIGETQCDHCEAYSECRTCNGTGEVVFGEADLDDRDIRDIFTISEYDSDVIACIRMLADWQQENVWEVLAEYGYTSWSRVHYFNGQLSRPKEPTVTRMRQSR